MRKRARQVRQGSLRVKKQISRTMLRNLVRFTPVDTTLHRSKWVVGLGSEAPSPTEPVGLKSRQWSRVRGLGRVKERTSAFLVVTKGVSVINTANSYDAIFISNDGPAIEQLERGKSRQAPQGILGPSLVRTRRQISRLKLFTHGTKYAQPRLV